MSSKRIYQQDQYAASNTAIVTEVQDKDGFDAIVCDSSVFFPEGGGQPSDIGTVASDKGVFEVTHAFDESLESDVWHMTDAPAGTFKVGDQVELAIDFDFRFRNMQRHLGEHMLSGTFDTLYGGINKGFHMGEDYITIDIDLGGRMLTDEELDLAERTVNEAVWADLPVTVTWFDDYESSRKMPVRKQVPHDGRVSVVTVGELPDPYDCIACCGTHPSSSGQVGLVALYKCEPNKGMNRVYFDCGSMALRRLSEDSHMLADISRRYSCKTADLPQRLDREAESISALKGRLAALASYAAEKEASVMLREIAEQGTSVYTYETDLFSTDELLKLGFTISAETECKLILLMQTDARTCLLFSAGDVKCGKLVKETAPGYNGRGGGRDDNARAVVSEIRDMKAFARAAAGMIE